MNNDSRRLEDLHPYYRPIVTEVLRRAPEAGLYPFIMSGKRNPEYQACLHARGRTSPGETHQVGPYLVSVRREGSLVVAACGDARYEVPASKWSSIVTNVLWSWHVLGFAVDLAFRSGPGKKDHWIGELEQKREWGLIESLYARLHRVWVDIAPDVRWGNDWDGDGIPVKNDPDESFVDMPHWEWHPGKSIMEVRAGKLPPFPSQCRTCRRFRPVMVDGECRDCAEPETQVMSSRRPADRDCVMHLRRIG